MDRNENSIAPAQVEGSFVQFSFCLIVIPQVRFSVTSSTLYSPSFPRCSFMWRWERRRLLSCF
ncbi:hypothetical protein E2C01_084482 [Portunus trituberculatus]|uniref:Uncharacterized protein n=1 Tax=Portunus trituberculatus TaxID=210409 RepID=A0A5B7IYD8_PORTR|nr:hypothetical protein [Portunus trituberculatus]